tara:strand:- start:3415 stop:3834 length:420 start_codon:yes stop_codon:yes gene_type:complete
MGVDRLTADVPEKSVHAHDEVEALEALEALEGLSRYLSFDCGLVLSCELIDGMQWYGSTLLNAIHARHHEEGHTATGWGILEKTTYADDGLSSEIGFACTCDEQYVVTVSTVIALAEKPKNLLMDWTKKDSPEWQEYPH